MKKSFLLLIAALIMGSSVFAQGVDIAIGPKIGYQTAKLSYDKASIKSEFSNHFTAGIFARVGIGNIYIQPELLYFKTSNIFDYNLTGTNQRIDIPTGVNLTLNEANLQLPVLVGIKLLDLDVICLRAQVGPTANFVLKSQTLVNWEFNNNTEQSEEIPEGFDTKSIAWGMQAGVGVDILNLFTLDINYNLGLTNIFNKLGQQNIGGHVIDFTNIDNTKQNLFMVTLGMKFL